MVHSRWCCTAQLAPAGCLFWENWTFHVVWECNLQPSELTILGTSGQSRVRNFVFWGEEGLPKLAEAHWRFQTICIEAENIKNKITFSVEFSSLMRNPFKECLTPILNEWCQSRYLVLHPTRRLAGSVGLGLGQTTECPLGNANRLQVLYFILYLVRYTKKLGQARITEF